MFSPSLQEGGPAKGTRSSRRRQRPLSSDSLVQQPKAKRQRVPLTETTFVSPDGPPEMFEVKSHQVDLVGIKRDGIENFAAAPRKELSVRSKKPKPGERVNKGDGSVVLTTNNAYTVSKLPALPDRIRADSQNRQHGAVYSSSGYALSLTHTHALVWPYTTTTPSPETFTFALPYPSKHASDPLPLGSLVAPSTTSEEPGLLVVMPVSGKVTFWESISSAATLDFIHQQRSGVEDVIPGMFSGEHVVQLVNAESAGFVLAFSSGRLAHLNVRDSHGRPAISFQFLRGGAASSGSGFFGSIRNVLSSSAVRGDIAAVRASPGTKVGERGVVAATSKGKLHAWVVRRGGQSELVAELDAQEQIAAAVRLVHTKDNLSQASFELLDLAFVPNGLERKYQDMSSLSASLPAQDERTQHIVLLVSFSSGGRSQYFLVEAFLSAAVLKTGMVRPITSYTSPVRRVAAERPRLYLPKPALVAFITFDKAAVMASLAAPPESPEAQLRLDSRTLPSSFEDVVDLRDDDRLEIVGSGTEEPSGNGPEDARIHRHRAKNPTLVLLVRGVGVIRIATSDADRFASEQPLQISAKSKLEQAVFFGTKDDNPLTFEGRGLDFSADEIRRAAVQLSNEILASKTPFIPSVPAALESNMRARSAYLDKLILHLNALNVDLDLRTRSQLLSNAEKMAVATWIWTQQEQFLAARAPGDKRTIVSETAVYINEEQKTEPNPAIGEVDPVRHWFIHDVWRLDIFVAWPYQVIKYNFQENLLDEAGINRLLYEAVTVDDGALREAHGYREEKCELYGIVPEKTHYEAMPEPWTATQYINNNLKRLVEFCHQWLDTYHGTEQGSVDAETVENIRLALPGLTSRYLAALLEYVAWGSAQNDPEAQSIAKLCAKTYEADRETKILRLKDFGLWDEAVELAQDHGAYRTMAEVMVEEIVMLRENASGRNVPASQAKEQIALANSKEKQMGEFFDEFGSEFAFKAYAVLLERSGVQAVLDFRYDSKNYGTEFLRSEGKLAKISWINDVEREKNLESAADTLIDLGMHKERQVWNKKIELSLGKLALLAQEDSEEQGSKAKGSDMKALLSVKHTNDGRRTSKLDDVDHQLSLIKIQDSVYSQIFPSISTAVDESAEIELAMANHGRLIPKSQRALVSLLENSLAFLLKHEVLDPPTLIDLLTLAYLPPGHADDIGDQFFLALRVAQLGLAGDKRSKAEQLIWRRCFIRDDWAAINETNSKGDRAQLQEIGRTAMYSTMFGVVDYATHHDNFSPFVKPSDALGVFTKELDSRFDGLEEVVRSRLLESMKWEDNKLRTFVESCQLDKWYRSTLEMAQDIVAREYSRLTAEQAGADDINGRENGSLFESNGTSKENGTLS